VFWAKRRARGLKLPCELSIDVRNNRRPDQRKEYLRLPVTRESIYHFPAVRRFRAGKAQHFQPGSPITKRFVNTVPRAPSSKEGSEKSAADRRTTSGTAFVSFNFQHGFASIHLFPGVLHPL